MFSPADLLRTLHPSHIHGWREQTILRASSVCVLSCFWGAGYPRAQARIYRRRKKKNRKTWEFTSRSSRQTWIPYAVPLLFIQCSRQNNAPFQPSAKTSMFKFPQPVKMLPSWQRDFANLIKLMTLRWRDDPELSGCGQ